MRIACLLKWFYGVTVAQEILVLLEIVRFSLELLNSFFLYLNYIHTCMTACESSCTLFIVDVFRRFFIYYFKIFFSTACDKSLSYAIKACR